MSQTIRRTIALLLASSLLLVACGDDDQADAVSEPGPATSAPSPADEGTAPIDEGADEEAPDEPVDLADWQSRQPECRDGDDRTVTHLDPVVIPAVDVAEVNVPDVELGGHTVAGFVVPGVQIPETVVDTGCIVEYHAPAGCLARVEITGYEIPGIEIPDAEIPAVEVPGRSLDARRASGGSQSARGQSARSVDQRCQREPTSGEGIVGAVIRPAMVRQASLRQSVMRRSIARPEICVDGECTPAVTVPPVAVSPVGVPAVSVNADALQVRVLEGATDTGVIDDERSTTFETPSDLFFAFDSSELGPEAGPTLETIAAQLERFGDRAMITVEGHTDSVGDDTYNLTLSEQRADAVATWLTEAGGFDPGRVTTRGHGSAYPVAPNQTSSGADDPDGRAQNRRVTISIAKL
ncbi:MAG: OmpA family protein [Acidimicrobiales bacterium]